MKKFFSLVTIAVFFCLLTFPAMAGQWQQDSVGWWWQNDDGSYPVSTWQWIDGNNDGIFECYFFDRNGYILVNTTTPDGYVLDANGAWTIDGVVQTQTSMSDISEVANDSISQPTQDTSSQTESSTPQSHEKRSSTSAQTQSQLPVGNTVFVSRTGSKYHRDRTCGTMKDPIEMSLQDAISTGHTPCSKCFR